MAPEPSETGIEPRPGPGRPRNPELKPARANPDTARVPRLRFANTQVQTIANHVGVGNGTVYRYFPTKDQLFLATVERGLQELTAEMDRVLDSSLEPPAILVEAIRPHLVVFHRRPDMAELFVQVRAAFPHHHRPLYFATQDDGARTSTWRSSSA